METHWKKPISNLSNTRIESNVHKKAVHRQIKRILFIISNAINNKDRDITLKQKINKRPRLAHVTLHVNNVEIVEDNFHTKEAKQNALHTTKPAINATKSVISPSTVYLGLKRQLQKMIKRKFDSSRQQ